jgi:hypothetical protein
VLCEFSPLHAIFSTPNYEANKAIRAAVNSADAVGDGGSGGDGLMGHTSSCRYETYMYIYIYVTYIHIHIYIYVFMVMVRGSQGTHPLVGT